MRVIHVNPFFVHTHYNMNLEAVVPQQVSECTSVYFGNKKRLLLHFTETD